MSLLITILFAISFNLRTAMSGWELLAEQNTQTGGYFGPEVKTQNVGNEGDALFSKIAGITNPSSLYQNADGKYTFRLIFTPKDGSVEQTIEWTQTSWLLDDVSPWATDVEIISAPEETSGDPGVLFRGLASTTNANCYIDGNGNGHGYWYNCVCSINAWNGGIPGYDKKAATRMRLWIDVPVVMPEYICLTTSISGYQHLNGQYRLRNDAWEEYQIIGLYESDKPDNCDDKTYRIWKWNAEYSWGVTWALGEFDYGECGINPEIVSDCNGYWVIDGTIRSQDEFQIASGGCLYGAACSTCSV